MRALIGLIVALTLGLIAATPLMQYLKLAIEARTTTATAGELRQISAAAKEYVQNNYSSIEEYTTPTSALTVSMSGLIQDGDLSPSIASTNPFGQTWKIEILQPKPGQLQTLVLSVGGSKIPESQAPGIAAQTGQEGGFIPYQGQYGTLPSSIAQGAYGHWQLSLAGYSDPGPGHLAALLAFNDGTLESDYLYRVAVPGQPQLNTMQTALNMGNNSITSANNVSAQSAQLAAGNPNGMPGSLQIGSSYIYGDSTNAAVRTPGGLYIQNQAGTAPSSINEVGSISASGHIGAAGEPANSGYPASWGGGVHTWDLYANGTVGAGTNGSVNSYFNSQGNGAVSNTFSVGSRLELGTANGQANAGSGCSPNGEIAANANGSGSLMVCVNGTWQAPGGLSQATQAFNWGYNTNNTGWNQNTSGHMEFITAYGDSTDNSCHDNGTQLTGYVTNQGLVDFIQDNNQSMFQTSSIYFFVQPGASWEITSNPWNGCGRSSFNVVGTVLQ